VAAIGLGIWYFVQTRKNYQTSIGQRLIPFTASVDPTTGQATPFTDAAGNPQLTCPAGKNINIVAAFFDIADPYGECSTSPGGIVGYLCNPSYSSPQGGTTDDDCPGGSAGLMHCNSNGSCQLTPLSSTSCPAGYSSKNFSGSYYCIPTDTCGPGVPNPICSPASTTNQCATRDATDSVGAKCNGRSECSDLTMADFGPYPCPKLAPPSSSADACIAGYDTSGNPVWNQARSGYCGLPYSPGWPGGAPANSTPEAGTPPPSSTLGYTMHGLYACV